MTIIGPTMTIIGPTTIVIGWTEPCASSHLVAVFDPTVHAGHPSHAERLQDGGRGSRLFISAVFTGRIWPAARVRSCLSNRNYGGHPAHASTPPAPDGKVQDGVHQRE